MISDKALKEFKEIWKEELGEDISDEKAVELGINLLTLRVLGFEGFSRLAKTRA